MKIIEPGLRHELEETVTYEKCARFIGSGSLEVYSTPAMIALMEKTSFQCIEEYLNKNETSVGGAVDILHLNPTAIGGKVICKTAIKSISQNKIEFEVEVYEKDKLIGKGKHIRFIINQDAFIANL